MLCNGIEFLIDRNLFDASVTLDQSHEYESTQMFGMLQDGIVLPRNIDIPMDSDNSVQPSSEEQSFSAEHQKLPISMTYYAKLGDRMSNPGIQSKGVSMTMKSTIQEDRSEVGIRTISKAPVFEEGVGFEHDPTREIYANAAHISPDGM